MYLGNQESRSQKSRKIEQIQDEGVHNGAENASY